MDGAGEGGETNKGRKGMLPIARLTLSVQF